MKNTKIILFASLAATLAFSLMQLNDVEATNLNGSWTHNNITFKCYVTGLTATSNVNACGDISISTNELEQGSLTITSTSSYGADVKVYAWNSCNCGVGKSVTNYNTNGEIQWSYNVLNKQLSYEDSNIDTSTNGYDWKTATAHEMGHSVGLADYTSNAYIMYGSLGQNDADRTLTTHSKNHIASEYQ